MAQQWKAGPSRRSTILVGARFVPVVVVPYETMWGDQGEVEIPVSQFTAEAAAAAIDAEVTELAKLRDL